MSVILQEQETTINIYRDRQECHIWTSDSTMITKLDKLCDKSPDFYKLDEVGKIENDIVSKDYIVTDKNLISFRSGRVILSEKQKQARAERMRNYHTSN